jgi:predicted nucleic acid-binding protein
VILVDTSVWIDHLRSELTHLSQLLRDEQILIHAMVVGELACGFLPDRAGYLEFLGDLPEAPTVFHEEEVLAFIERNRLMGRGIGYVDVHLLASAMLAPDTQIWSTDRRLQTVSAELGLAYQPAGSEA